MLRRLKSSKLGKKLKNSKLYDSYRRSCGDWRYPILSLEWNISRWLTPRRIVKSGRVKFSLSCSNWIEHFRWYLFSQKETEVRMFIDKYVREGDVFFDIGANVGVFSLYCAKYCQDVQVYCFEPEYSNLFLLKENILKNNLTDKMKPYSLAISDEVGLSYLNIQDSTPGAAAHSENKQKLKITDEGYPVIWSEGIMTVTIDYLSRELKVLPNILKIDTDGNEEKVLKGAQQTLSQKVVRSLIIEMPMEDEKHTICRNLLLKSGLKLDWEDKLNTRNQIWSRSNA